MKKLAVIIPARFRPDLLRVCLDSLFNYRSNYQLDVVLVQDGEDEEIEKLKSQYPEIKYWIKNDESQGPVTAMNTAFQYIWGKDFYEYVMLLNADTVCTPGWLEAMLSGFGICGRGYTYAIEGVGLVGPTLTACGGIQSIENNKGQEFDIVDEIEGVCMMFSSGCVEALLRNNKQHGVSEGLLLDDRYGLGGGDDNDVCMRVKLAGFKTVVARKAFLYHYISASFRKLFNDDIPYSKRNCASQFYKFREKWKDQKELGYKPRIFIAIPVVNGYVRHELSVRLIEWSHDPEMTVSIKYYPGLSPLDHARNRAVKDFLEDYWDYFMMIDADTVPPQNCLRELLGADKDVVCPLVFTFKVDDKGIPFPIPVANRYDENGAYRPYYEGNGVTETDTITGGCFLIKRKVLEQLERPFYFTYHKNGIVEYSEDFIFSQQAQKLGYKLYTNYGVRCRHFKEVDVLGINNLMVSK